MLEIDGRWECLAEYLDRCIGQQAVVDLIKRGKTFYYVFENGHELPLLCFCCGGPLVYEYPDSYRQDMRGRRLKGMGVGPVTLEDGTEAVQFELEFSKKGLLSPEVHVLVAVEVAAQMRHPDNCPYKGRSQPRTGSWKAKESGRRRRRRRLR